MPKDSAIKKDPSKNIPRLAKKYPNWTHEHVVGAAMGEKNQAMKASKKKK